MTVSGSGHPEKQYRALIKKEKDPELLVEAYTGLGAFLYEAGRYEESEFNLLKACELMTNNRADSKSLQIYRTLGLLYIKLMKFSEAKKYLKTALNKGLKTNDRVRSIILDALGDACTGTSDSKSGEKYYKEALKIRQKLSLRGGVSETLNKLGMNYYYRGDYSKAIKYFTRSLKMRRERKEKKHNIAECLSNLCLSNYRLGLYDIALTYGLEALDMFEKTGHLNKYCQVLNNLGKVYFEMSLHSDALECLYKAMYMIENANNSMLFSDILCNISRIFTKLFNLDKALEYAKRSLEIRIATEDIRAIADSYNEIGRIYDKRNDFINAEKYYLKSIEIIKKTKSPFGLVSSLENIGMLFLKQKRYDEAGEKLFEAKKISEDMGEMKNTCGIIRNIASYYLNLNDLTKALEYANISHDMASELNLKDKLRDAYRMLYEICRKQGSYKKALGYFERYSSLKEELLDLSKQHEINNIIGKYESYHKDKEVEFHKMRSLELTNLNIQLKKSRSELIRSNYSKDKFFNIIAHDLKNPFSILYTTSELLNEYYDDITEQKRKEYINTINLSVRHLLKLIENLLEWARSQRGMKQFKPEKFSFSESLKVCIDLIRPNADIKNIGISYNEKEDIFVTADRNMIRSVLRNLLTNAVKFTKRGGQIKISTEVSEDFLKFEVTDNGVGIRKRDIPKLFVIDKHYVSNGTENEKGTGLGLILCKEFIEKHGGNLYVRSKFRKGSTFGFEIPIDPTIS